MDLTKIVHQPVEISEYEKIEIFHQQTHRRAFDKEADSFAKIEFSPSWESYKRLFNNFLETPYLSAIGFRKTNILFDALDGKFRVPMDSRPFFDFYPKNVRKYRALLEGVAQMTKNERDYLEIKLSEPGKKDLDRAILVIGARESLFVAKTQIPSNLRHLFPINGDPQFSSYMAGLSTPTTALSRYNLH